VPSLGTTLASSYVADGRLAAYVLFFASAVHVAAGSLLITEAGGVVSDIDGRRWTVDSDSLVGSADSELHEELLGLGEAEGGQTMDALRLTTAPAARAAMLIRRPVGEVFQAFVDPDVTTKFWFTKGTGRLEVGKPVEWSWEMYRFSIPLTATAIEPNERIAIEWPGEHGATTSVEWRFEPLADGATFVRITHTGFAGDGDEVLAQVTGSTEGFSLVLAGLKAWMEHGIRLNLVADRFPKGLSEGREGNGG
jgi:uncharacterized protein YndB with AHSA1/START domain